MQPKILVIGAGAIGAYYGARLAQAGADVSVVVRSDYEGLIEKGGYTIQSHQGDFSFKPSQILKTPGDFQGTADYVIVATKVLPGSDTRELLKNVVSESTTIVLLQNGVDRRACSAGFSRYRNHQWTVFYLRQPCSAWCNRSSGLWASDHWHLSAGNN
jgi:2-dehydropantoate 2-reductase